MIRNINKENKKKNKMMRLSLIPSKMVKTNLLAMSLNFLPMSLNFLPMS
jgi:hypothetical protein